MTKKELSRIVVIILMAIPSLCFSFDNSNIRDPNNCPRLLNSILSPGESDIIYKMSLSPEGNGFSSDSGRYDYIEVEQLRLAEKSYRTKIVETKGRLFYKGATTIEKAQSYFDKTVESPVVVFSVPDGPKSIKRVYGQNLSKENVHVIQHQMDKVNSSLSDLSVLKKDRNGNPLSEKFIDELIRSGENDTIILVGHNKNGLFLLPNGEGISISAIQKKANENGKTLLVISCNSIDNIEPSFKGIVSLERLNYESVIEGLELVEENKCRFTGCAMFMGDYIYYLDQGIALNVKNAKDKTFRTKMVFAIVIGSAATGTFIVSPKEDTNENIR